MPCQSCVTSCCVNTEVLFPSVCVCACVALCLNYKSNMSIRCCEFAVSVFYLLNFKPFPYWGLGREREREVGRVVLFSDMSQFSIRQYHDIFILSGRVCNKKIFFLKLHLCKHAELQLYFVRVVSLANMYVEVWNRSTSMTLTHWRKRF